MSNILIVGQCAKLRVSMSTDPDKALFAITGAARVSRGVPMEQYGAHSSECDERLVKNLLKWGHMTPFEFVNLCFEIVTSRAVARELLRHRHAGYVMESQRYCNYKDCLPVLEHKPDGMTHGIFMDAVRFAHDAYLSMLQEGAKPEDSRVLLPECVATKIAMCCNLREFRHILSLRLDKAAWTPIRELVGMMKEEFLQYYPSVLLDGVVKE